MDCVAEVLVILGSHDPHNGTDRGHMVPVPTPAFTKHRLRRQVSGQCCSKFSGSWMQNQVRHSLIDVGCAMYVHLKKQCGAATNVVQSSKFYSGSSLRLN
jgi:hypothetical protein